MFPITYFFLFSLHPSSLTMCHTLSSNNFHRTRTGLCTILMPMHGHRDHVILEHLLSSFHHLHCLDFPHLCSRNHTHPDPIMSMANSQVSFFTAASAGAHPPGQQTRILLQIILALAGACCQFSWSTSPPRCPLPLLDNWCHLSPSGNQFSTSDVHWLESTMIGIAATCPTSISTLSIITIV